MAESFWSLGSGWLSHCAPLDLDGLNPSAPLDLHSLSAAPLVMDSLSPSVPLDLDS